MKITSGLLVFTFVAVSVLTGCGPTEEELAQQELARQDSLEQVSQEEPEEMAQDSLAGINQIKDASGYDDPVNETFTFEYSDNGAYTVQIEAWRSEAKAHNQAEMWKNRDFNNTFIISYGNPEVGDVWYRVRLGKFETLEMAQNFKNMLKEDYNTESWVSKTGEYPGSARGIN